MEDATIWQGFEAPIEVAAAAKLATDIDARVSVWKPAVGQPPFAWNRSGTRAMWAVQVDPANPIPCPPGCEEADPVLVGRLVEG